MEMYGTISPSLLTTILKKNVSARDVWISLENLFRDNNDARAIQLDSDLRNITLGDMSIGDYFQRIKSISHLLQNIDKPVDEKTIVIYMHFLSMIDTINVVVVTISAAVAAITMAADFSMAPNHPFGPSPGRMGGVFLARILGNIRSSLRLGVHRSSTPATMGQ
ncbi:developmental and secondary metabolism regulator VEA1-like protein [Tanacetum coccineum]